MGYTNFNRQVIVVLNGFQAAAYVNEYNRRHNYETFTDEGYDDALYCGTSSDIIRPLADDQFHQWFIEYIGNIHAYNTEYIRSGKELLFAVPFTAADAALSMFGGDWLALRKYVLWFTEL